MKKIVLFLHGYGSNGNDLISLKDYISLEKEETEFISPNAPEPCEFNYFGYQWFPLKERSIEELKEGLKTAFFHLEKIIEKIVLLIVAINISPPSFTRLQLFEINIF